MISYKNRTNKVIRGDLISKRINVNFPVRIVNIVREASGITKQRKKQHTRNCTFNKAESIVNSKISFEYSNRR